MNLNWWQAIILGFVQGATEFLPISSSGHLALAENLFGLAHLSLTFDLMVHAGTLVATIFFFWPQLKTQTRQNWLIIAIATLPAAVIGIVFKDLIEVTKNDKLTLFFSFLITAFMVFLADLLLRQEQKNTLPLPVQNFFNRVVQLFEKKHPDPNPSFIQAFCIGILQATALLPAVSRSGSTLLGGLLVGMNRQDAFSFAFIIGIPAIAGAIIFDLVDVVQAGDFAQHPWGLYMLGAVVAGVVGMGSLKVLEMVIYRSQLRYFAIYVLFVSIVTLLFA